jgi:predicted house-cleaning noncanonical NTP pyrophosphatase (MazG superfamily)
MGPFEMVVAIIFIVTIGKIIQTKQKAKHGIVEDEDFLGTKTHRLLNNAETQQMQDEIRALKDRIQVLERIATDNNSTHDLNRQIEELRSR